MKSIIFYQNAEKHIIGGTALDENREPVDGYTGMQPDQAVQLLAGKPGLDIEFVEA